MMGFVFLALENEYSSVFSKGINRIYESIKIANLLSS